MLIITSISFPVFILIGFAICTVALCVLFLLSHAKQRRQYKKRVSHYWDGMYVISKDGEEVEYAEGDTPLLTHEQVN